MISSTVTLLLIGITVVVSYSAFNNNELLNKCMFYPVAIKQRNEWWRFFTHGFVHADLTHLLFNMLTLYFFGPIVETIFGGLFGNPFIYPLFYILALFSSSVPSFEKYKANSSYMALGASGAVSAVLFATILFDPWQTLRLYFAIPIPAIVFGVLYIWYSSYMSKHGRDNIGHDAHLWGAVFGLIFPLALRPSLFFNFLELMKHPRFLS